MVPGGTTVRTGAHLEPGVTIMPPAYVNVGAWVGRGTMVDSHALVGSCAQVGERVHLSAAVQVGGVLEPVGARPVVVEDDAFVGGGCGLYDGVIVGRGAVLGAGVDPHRPDRGSSTWSRSASSGHARTRRWSSRPVRSWCRAVARRAAATRPTRASACTCRSSSSAATRAPTRASRWRRRSDERCCSTGRWRAMTRASRPASTVAGLDPEALVRDHGSPLFVYDLDVVAARVAMLRAAMPDGVEVAYAVKANPSPAILRLLASLGLGADIASGASSTAVTRTGFDLRRVVMTGPGKTDAEIAAAVRAGVRAITIESLEEVDVLLDMASLAGRHQGLMLRLAADETGRTTEGTPIISAAGAAKFGLLPRRGGRGHRPAAAGRAPSARPGRPTSCWASMRSAPRTCATPTASWSTCAGSRTGRGRCATRHGLRFRLLDAGGGLGIPYADDQAPLDVGRLGSGIAAELATWTAHPGLQGARLLLEPGRFLVGPAGAYLTRVVRTKQRAGRTMADHRRRHPPPAAAGAGRRAASDRRRWDRRPSADRLVPASVVGPLCTGLDLLSRCAGPARPAHGRPARGARCGCLRLHRVDAPVPVAPGPGRGRRVPGRRAGRASASGAGRRASAVVW